MLGGALLSAAVFGFPVFCLICPIGLTFATILLVINLFAHGDVTWSIIVVPALLIAEVVLFRKWCHKLCPLSAFMSLIGKANKTFVPAIDDAKCLETAKGTACGACGRACDEGIDPRHPQLSEGGLDRVHEVPRVRGRLPHQRHHHAASAEEARSGRLAPDAWRRGGQRGLACNASVRGRRERGAAKP